MSREQLPAPSFSPFPAQLVRFVAARHNELRALSGCGDALVASFKRARGGHGPGTWMSLGKCGAAAALAACEPSAQALQDLVQEEIPVPPK